MAYTKPDIKELVAGGLTGWEAGRLILRESYWGGKGQGVLTAKEKEAIRNSLKTVGDTAVFNYLMEVGQVLELAQLKANITALQVLNSLLKGSLLIVHIISPPATSKPPDLEEKHQINQEYLGYLNIEDKNTLKGLKVFKAFMLIMEEASQALGLPEYQVEMTNLYHKIEAEIEAYNSHLTFLKLLAKKRNIQADLPHLIKPKQTKPVSQVVKAWRERIGRGQSVGGLGEGWWRNLASKS